MSASAISASCIRATAATSASPRPAPGVPRLGSSRTKRPSARSRSASGMPGPRSATTSAGAPASRVAATVIAEPAGACFSALSTRFESASASSWSWPWTTRPGAASQASVEPALLGGGLVELGDVGGEAAEVDRAELLGADAGLDPADVEERGRGREHALRLALRLLDPRLPGLGRRGLVGGGLEVAHQPAERAPEVVRQAVGDGAQVAHQRLDPVEHGVQRAGEAVELVVGAAHGDPAVERARHDAARRAVDLGDPAAHQPRQQPAGEKRQRGQRGERPRAARGRACGRRRRARRRRGRRSSSSPRGSSSAIAEISVGRDRSVR